jgi:AcrR family transcriptional regulator
MPAKAIISRSGAKVRTKPPPKGRANVSRRARDRASTEVRILEATWRLFEREGPLAGINLQEVADEAGVNRSLVYQYFGTREELVRRALARRLEQAQPSFAAGYGLPFSKRRLRAFKVVLADPLPAKLMAQLVLVGDPDARVLPMLEGAQTALQRDVADGSLPPDADVDVLHAMTAVVNLGYAVLREHLAEELGMSLQELDRRAAAVFDQMLEGAATGAPSHRARDPRRRPS